MPFDPMSPGSLYIATVYDEATELVEALMAATDGDELADLLEHGVDKSDRAHAVLFVMLARARGMTVPTSGVEVSVLEETPTLILPTP